MKTYVTDQDCFDFVKNLQDGSVDLFLTDPPYKGIVKESWDNQWKTTQAYVDWLYSLLEAVKPKMKENGSVIFFGGVGKHGDHPFFETIKKIDDNNLYTYRNMITWAKKRGYGKSHDYLFTREEIVWYSVSPERTKINFNKPMSKALRGYAGYKQDVKVGYSTIYCHTLHENNTNACMSPGSQAQSKRDVLLLLRQMSVLQESESKSAQTQSVVGEKTGSSSSVFRSVEEAESIQKNVNSASGKRKKAQYSLCLDRGRLEGGVDWSLSSSGNSHTSQQSAPEQLIVSGSDRQLCWVCTREHLRNVLASKQTKDGCVDRGAGSSGEFHEISLTKKQMKYPALSAYKRITNVWTDIPELFKPARNTQKPIPLMARFIETHSNPGDLVVDPFSGWGTTGIAALQLGRDFSGCERITADAILANDRCLIHAPKRPSPSVPLVTLV